MSEFLTEDDLQHLEPASRAFASSIPARMVSTAFPRAGAADRRALKKLRYTTGFFDTLLRIMAKDAKFGQQLKAPWDG